MAQISALSEKRRDRGLSGTIGKMFGALRITVFKWQLAPAALLVLTMHIGESRAQAGLSAEQLFREGRAALLEGKLEDARLKFEASATLDPTAGTLLNLAECDEKLGKTATAVAVYIRAREAAIKRERTEWVNTATARIAALQPTLPRLRVTGVIANDAQVQLDGAELVIKSAADLTPIDPGSHTLVVLVSGKEKFRREFTARAGAVEELVVPAEPTASTEVLTPVTPFKPPVAQNGSALPWVLAAGSGLALGTAGVLTLVRNGQVGDMTREGCSGLLPQDKLTRCDNLKEKVISKALPTIALVGAGVLAVAAVSVYFATKPASAHAQARLLCVPELTGGSCIVQF
jgi:hypothetical protein